MILVSIGIRDFTVFVIISYYNRLKRRWMRASPYVNNLSNWFKGSGTAGCCPFLTCHCSMLVGSFSNSQMLAGTNNYVLERSKKKKKKNEPEQYSRCNFIRRFAFEFFGGAISSFILNQKSYLNHLHCHQQEVKMN